MVLPTEIPSDDVFMTEFKSWAQMKKPEYRSPLRSLKHLISSMTNFESAQVLGEQQDALFFFTIVAGREPRTEVPGMLH